MRAWLLAIVPAILLAVLPSTASAGEAPRLRYRIGDFFPSEIDLQVPTDLIGSGCMTVYVHGVTNNGCPILRGESSWVNFEIWWENARRPVQLTRTRAELLVAGGPKAPPLEDGALGMTWQPTAGVSRTQTGFVLAPGSRMIVRIDLSGIAATAPAGNYELCFAPALVPRVPVRWAPGGESDGCYRFWLRGLTDTRLRLESLRRQSIELVAARRCDEASQLVDEMLAVHPASAVAYRLRAIIAELQRRVPDAALDLAHASDLVKSGADPFLIFDEPARQALGDNLTEWSEGLSFADPVHGFLGAPADGGPECR